MARKAPKKNETPQESSERLDSYQEIFLNVGTAGDPFNYGGVGRARIMSRPELERIYMADGIGKRIVDIVPEEAFRNGFTIDGADEMPEIRSRWDALDASNKLTDAMCWARLYGGAVVVMGINDGSGEMDTPAGQGEIEFLRVYDRYSVKPFQVENNPLMPNFGEVSIYEITPMAGVSYRVHISRMIVIDGERIPDRVRHRNGGWGASCLQGIAGALTDFGVSHQMATSLLARKQQGVWKINDLSMMCRDRQGKGILRERLNQVDMTRSNNNSIALDAVTEDYVLLNGDLSGVTDVIGEKKSLLTMLSGIHESILTGENVSGINANENTALASFHQLVSRYQVDVARPVIEMVVTRLGVSRKEWNIKFNPLSVESDAQKADRMQKQSQADATYLQEQVLDEDEVRDTLRKRGDYQMKTGNPEIDPARQANQSNTPEEDEAILNAS